MTQFLEHLSPEIIENMSKELIVDIKNLAVELHQSTIGILETPLPSAEIDRQIRLRSSMKLKIDEASGYLKSQLSDLEAVLRDLRTKKGYLTSDNDRLTSLFFSTLRAEKQGDA
mgnify:CR=1 FL=1